MSPAIVIIPVLAILLALAATSTTIFPLFVPFSGSTLIHFSNVLAVHAMLEVISTTAVAFAAVKLSDVVDTVSVDDPPCCVTSMILSRPPLFATTILADRRLVLLFASTTDRKSVV